MTPSIFFTDARIQTLPTDLIDGHLRQRDEVAQRMRAAVKAGIKFAVGTDGSVCRSVVNDGLPSWSKLAFCLVGQKKAILFSQEKARGDGVDPDLIRILLRQVHRQPLGEIADRCLGR